MEPRVGELAEINGLSMYYEIHGTGLPVVLLHGAFGTIDSCFSQLLPRLAVHRQVIAVELQGHGHTHDVDRPLSYQGMARDVADLMSLLNYPLVDVVGYSMGGGVAIEMAVATPQLVRRLVFAGGPAYKPEGVYPEITQGPDAQDPGAPPATLEGSPWHRAYLKVAPDPAQWGLLVEKLHQLDRSFEGWTPLQLRSISSPVMLIAGDADIVRPDHVIDMFRLFGGGVPGDLVPMPASRLAFLPGTSHVGLLDRTEWLDSMIHEFLVRPNND